MIGAVQLRLSNGTESPVFLAKDETDADLVSFNVNDYSKIKSIKATLLNDKNSVHKIAFAGSDGSEISKVETGDYDGYGPDFKLDPNEEIIGVYGTKNNDAFFYNIGFIVWTPPKVVESTTVS